MPYEHYYCGEDCCPRRHQTIVTAAVLACKHTASSGSPVRAGLQLVLSRAPDKNLLEDPKQVLASLHGARQLVNHQAKALDPKPSNHETNTSLKPCKPLISHEYPKKDLEKKTTTTISPLSYKKTYPSRLPRASLRPPRLSVLAEALEPLEHGTRAK